MKTKSFFIAIFFLILGYVLSEVLKDYIYEKSKQAYQNSLFPKIAKLEQVNGQSCTPSFIYYSKSQFLLYCDSINTNDPVLREELRKSVKYELVKWAQENDFKEHFLYVSFMDEIVQTGKK